MTDAIDFSVKPDLLAALRTPWREAMERREATARRDAARIARAKRAELAHDVRSWRNCQARFWARVTLHNAGPVAPKPLPRPMRPCGVCSWHRACTCPLWKV